jgi:hypothetical protein
MLRKNIGSKRSGCASSSSSSVREPLVHLDVDHEEALDTPTNDADSSITGCGFGFPFIRNTYSDKLISEWKLNLSM